jgi:antitoxin CptB
MAIKDRRKKLLYRATYRGFKEADLLIGGFAAAHVESFDGPELDEFEALLELDDRQLYDWATQKSEPPRHIIGPVFERLMAFKLV